MASTATRKSDARKRVGNAESKAKATATAKKVKPVEPETVTATIEASTIVPIELVRGKFDKEGNFMGHESGNPKSNGGVCFSEVDDEGNQVKEPVVRAVYVSQDVDNASGNPTEATLLFVVG
jgi:hypothetical protein